MFLKQLWNRKKTPVFKIRTQIPEWSIEEIIVTTYRNQIWEYRQEELNIDPPEYALHRIKELYTLNYGHEMINAKVIDGIVSSFQIYLTQLREGSRISKLEYGK